MAYYQPQQPQQQPQGYYPPPPPPAPQQQDYYAQQQQPPPQQQGYYSAQSPPAYDTANQASYYNDPSQYTQSQQQQPPPQPPGDYSGGYEKFTAKPRYNDLWAAILFAVHLVGFIVLAVFAIPKMAKGQVKLLPATSGSSADPLIQLIVMMAIGAVISFVISVIYFFAMQRFAGPMIKITLVLSVILYLAQAALFALLRIYVAAVIMLIFGLLYAWAAWTWRSRIPFATVMLETVCSVSRKYGGTFGVTIGGMILEMAWAVLWLVTVAGAMVLTSNEKCQPSTRPGRIGQQCTTEFTAVTWVVLVFCLLSFYWTSQVLKNIIHVTVCGVFGTFYFLEGTAQMPTGSVTLGSMRRAVTSAFGSICFGSLIIALVQTTRAVLRGLAESNDGILAFVACIFACILAYIEALIEYFNRYAFAQVAIYGKPFCQAARDTWTMIKDRGIEAIINDNLIGNVLGMGMLLVGFVTATIGFLYLYLKDKAFVENNVGYTVLAAVACFAIGVAMMSIVTSVIDSGVVSTFVALGEDPMALARTKPELFERIRQTWPDVVVGVH